MKREPIRVLLVEDNPDDVRLLRRMFRTETPGAFVFTHVECMSAALAELARQETDVLLLDMGLPDGQGLESVRQVHAAAPEVPLIILTGLEDPVLAAQAIQAGAQDYLIKGQAEVRALPRVLRYAIERHRLQAQSELVAQQQLKLRDDFLSHVSHELRAPLTAVHQFVSILMGGLAGEVNDEQRECLTIALRNCRQLKSLVDDLIEAAAVQGGKARIDPRSVSVPVLVEEAVASFRGAAGAKGITLSWEADPQVSAAYGDPVRVQQILVILIDNALKFTPVNGAIMVRVRPGEIDPRTVLCEVSDSGPGIPTGMLESVFDRLVQAPDKRVSARAGLGLGLHICRDLVQRQGGTVWARNAAGGGAILAFTLPVFSIAGLIAPAVQTASSTDQGIAVIVTEIAPASVPPAGDASTVSQDVRSVLNECMHPETDVLLPRMDHSDRMELFFIVAVTDPIGADEIKARVLVKLAGSAGGTVAGPAYTATCRVLRPERRRPNELMDAHVERVASDIQHIMDAEASSVSGMDARGGEPWSVH